MTGKDDLIKIRSLLAAVRVRQLIARRLLAADQFGVRACWGEFYGGWIIGAMYCFDPPTMVRHTGRPPVCSMCAL